MLNLQDRWYQTEAETSIFDYFYSGKVGNPIVAMPTGTGKSIVIAKFVRSIFQRWPGQRIMMLTHVKKLIEQNASKLMDVWPTAPLGIYSAGLNSRDMILPIVFGGVQSVAKAIQRGVKETMIPIQHQHFGYRDLLLIDECHLLSPQEDTQYQYVISELRKINPNLKIIGFTATKYRLKQGELTDEGLFTDVCYDITGVESFNRLIAEGYIAPLFPKRTQTTIDLSGVGLAAGDFNNKQLENAVDKDEITYSAVREMCEYGHDRKAWLVFASGVDNAEHIASMLQSFGVPSAAVHSKLGDKENDKRIDAFVNGEMRALVNMGMLTTGFDYPAIDLIGMLRPTLSPGLWVQMLGRGTRPSPGKNDCLCLDFAGNTRRLGPINDPKIPRKPGKGGGDVPVRICDGCGTYNHAAARQCICCGIEFPFETKLFETASSDALLAGDAPMIEWIDVGRVIYNLHEKKNKEGVLMSPPMIRASYFAGFSRFEKFIGLEHPPGRFLHDSKEWWRMHHCDEPPITTWQALQRTNELRWPKKIRVWLNKKYPEILGFEF